MALPENSGKVAGGFGSFKSTKYEELVMILHNNAAGNRWGPVLRRAGLRARWRLGARESSKEHFGGSRRLCGASRVL